MEGEAGRLVMLNGRVVSPERAVVSVYDRGFLYGDSVFEVLRTYGRSPFSVTEHVNRLFESARRVGIEMPVSKPALENEIVAAAQQAGGATDSVVRVQVTRGTGPLGLDPSFAREPLRVVIVEPIHLPSVDDYRDGVGVMLVQTERTADNTAAAGAKVANYLVSLLALRDAYGQGAKEAIILDGRGRVLEGTTSNVFAVKDGVLMTPPESEGILPGITRMHVLRAAESFQLPVRITTLCRGDLTTADEVFLSSTVREILPVVRVDGGPVGAVGGVGRITREIHVQFRRQGGLPMNMPWEASDEMRPAGGRGSLGK